jgi:hypothetical protein
MHHPQGIKKPTLLLLFQFAAASAAAGASCRYCDSLAN